MSMSSRATPASPMKPPASEKEKPEVLADHALKLAAALKALSSGPTTTPRRSAPSPRPHPGEHRAADHQERHEAARRRATRTQSGIVASAPELVDRSAAQ